MLVLPTGRAKTVRPQDTIGQGREISVSEIEGFEAECSGD
jgi:hypothetical protein